jgi:hypothetical protein
MCDVDEIVYGRNQQVGSRANASDLVFELCHVLILRRTPAALIQDLVVFLNLSRQIAGKYRKSHRDYFFHCLSRSLFTIFFSFNVMSLSHL